MLKLFFSLSFLLPISAGVELKMGIFLPFTGTWPGGSKMASAIVIALDKIKNDTTLLQDHNFTYFLRDSSCRGNLSLAVLSDYYYKENVDVFIGPGCSVGCIPGGLLADHWNQLMISWGCSASVLSNKEEYPTFVRTAGTHQGLGKFFSVYLAYMKWKRMALMCSTESLFVSYCSGLQVELQENNFTIPYYGNFNPYSVTHETLVGMFKAAKEKSHIFFIASYGNGVRMALLAAKANGMMNGIYAFYSIETLYSSCSEPDDTAERNAEACATWEGLIDVRQYVPETPEYIYFQSEVRRRMPEMNYTIFPNETVNVFASYLHDAILLYAYAVNDTIAQNGTAKMRDGRLLMKHVIGRSFQGASGPVTINKNGDREVSYMLKNVKDGAFQNIYNYWGDRDEMEPLNVSILWPGGGSSPPLGRPVCGFDSEFCPEAAKEETEIWPFILAAVLVVVGAAVAFGGYVHWQRKKAFEAAVQAQKWRMNYQDIQWPKDKKAMGSRKSMLSLGSQGAVSQEEVRGQVFTTLGVYEGTLVAVKKINKPSIILNREQLLELKEVKDLNHQNVNTFVGACVEQPNICLVTHYCNRGSLQDILYNDDMKLDWMFQMSIACDIARGIQYIHNSPIVVHGNIKSSNVVIDSRWTCKLTDYGLFLFKSGNEIDVEAGYNEDYGKLWTAPEHLNSEFIRSPSGDMYSYGIILSEIVTANLPFGMYEDMDLKGIIARVKKEEDPPFRPRITNDLVGHPNYIQLAKDCWNQSPPLRPKPNECLRQLKMMNKGKEINIMDNMINMMEKYTNHLEDIVADRTKELQEEKAKTDELLYRMLPRSVAEELKRGQTVTAETFDCVTIFFSDIVGFTKLAGGSTPLQVVDLLNDLYTTFDEIIDLHDVYKVETIGDAYMVASGLPTRNGQRHAGEIANMSLDLLAAMTTFKIRHVPGQQLQLRIGVHSGPAVAGVVGLKMPRYCLFGDTVNYASRIESSGLALRIHVSPECRDILVELGGYHLEKRGEVAMKGKGTICTYFLNGKDGFNKALPDLSLQAGMDEHTFK